MRLLSRKYILLLAVIFAALSLCTDALAQDNPGALFAISDGKGHISLLWFPPASKWPSGGWKLSDSTGRILAPQIQAGDAAALQALSVEDRDSIQKLPAVLSKPDSDPKHRQLINILGLRVFSDPAYARALGLSWTLDKVAPGSRTYKVDGLDGSGKSIVQLTSPPVDSSQATQLPPAPSDVQAKGDETGVSLFWSAPAENHQLPVIAYTIERDGGGQSAAPVNARPVVLGVKWDPKKPLVLDRNAPGNEMLTYHVFSLDIFGRRSADSSIRIFYQDYRALAPPEPVTAIAEPGKILVSWNATKIPNRAGYVVERSLLFAGPYEALSPQPLPPDANQYEDAGLQGGTTYYYRVRSVDSRGDLGTPSSAPAAQPKNPGAPPKVEGLTADAGQTRVRLTWKPVSFPVAGYVIERRITSGTGAAENWTRLNAHVTPEPLYDDYLGLTSYTTLEYRVIAIAFDNAEGLPSNSIQVAIADRSVPEPPMVTASSGAGGKASFSFEPASPEKTSSFLVLRSGRRDDLGLVIGDPLPANARTFSDLYVSPGESYWYRLVAVDKNGNHSDPTQPVVIRVGSPTIPKPAAPSLQFVTTPYPRVVLQFAPPPVGLNLIVERQDSTTGGWLRIAGPMSATTAVDNNPALTSGATNYRISYLTNSGTVGQPSDTVSYSATEKH